MAKQEDLYDPIKETSIDDISAAYLSGRQQGSSILSETLQGNPSKIPAAINYSDGNPYLNK